MELLKRSWQSIKIHFWPNLRQKESLSQSLKEVRKFNIFATIAESQRLWGQQNGNWNAKKSKGREADFGFGDVMKIIDTITSYLASFSQRFENHNSSTQSSRDINPNTRAVWVKKGTHASALDYVHASILPICCDFGWLFAFLFFILACFFSRLFCTCFF